MGRGFHGLSLLEDQAHVIDQFVALAKESRVDAILLAGDVYDRASPPADAVQLLDQTLTRLVIDAGIPVVVIAGNHDSGERLGFGSRLMNSRGLHVAGTTPLRVVLGDTHGEVEIVAVPFAEPAAVAARYPEQTIEDSDTALRADLLAVSSGATSAQAASDALQGARRIAVAHAFVSGGSTSESERPLVMGNAALVAANCFDGFAYAALGHLHRPQKVGRPEVRYSGSLLKYSFDEADHRKSVSLVEMDAQGACTIEEIALSPRRDVRVLEGTMEELRAAAPLGGAREDYVLARLADRGAVLDAIGKLRAAYPNCLRVQRTDEALAERAGDGEARVDLRRHSETEMFEAFFAEVTGEPLSQEESAAFEEALAAVRRSAQAAD